MLASERTDEILLPRQLPLHFTVDRDDVLKSGRLILRLFGANRVPIEVSFRNEKGSGPGVTREFFAQISREFRKIESLWRDNDEFGLFPSSGADPQLFDEIGLLVGKALSMNCVLELPINPAFFKLVRGEEIALADVDGQLDRVLRSDLRGLDYEYPGAFSVAGCTVNSENQTTFADAVRQHCVAGNARKCAEAFRNGMGKVIPIGLFSLFTAEEISALLSGQPFDEGEFLTHTDVRGYEKDPPQIVDLAAILAEFAECERRMFLMFVTGSNSLPAGGLRELHPKMSVQRMAKDGCDADLLLPTSFVCANILNLPPYSSRSILRAKLLRAIMDGNESFHLD
jgi:E3 ubiquitin-protein ligase TRIP12